MAVTPVQRKKYFEARTAGFSIAESARKAKFSEATAYRVEKAAQNLRVSDTVDTSATNSVSYTHLTLPTKRIV